MCVCVCGATGSKLLVSAAAEAAPPRARQQAWGEPEIGTPPQSWLKTGPEQQVPWPEGTHPTKSQGKTAGRQTP